jgi:acetoin utilization deacetylase AcuC-like enzyme
MATLLVTHPAFLGHDTGFGHPERADRMRAIDKVLAHESYNALHRAEASLRPDVEEEILRAHPPEHLARIKGAAVVVRNRDGAIHNDGDTVRSPGTYQAALRAVEPASMPWTR